MKNTILTILALILLLPASVSAAETEMRIDVADEAAGPVFVVVRGEGFTNMYRTDKSGHLVLRGLPEGDYSVRATPRGENAIASAVDVRLAAGESVRISSGKGYRLTAMAK